MRRLSTLFIVVSTTLRRSPRRATTIAATSRPCRLIAAAASAFIVGLFPGCGGAGNPSGYIDESSGGGSGGGGNGGSGSDGGQVIVSGNGNVGSFGDGSAGPVVGTPLPRDGGAPCPPGLACNVACSGGTSTTITGKVYDPAGRNPLYNVAVYVPATPLQPLPKGVPTGADACSCPALFKSGALSATSTAVDGSFTLPNVPVGNVTLALQIGKWRRAIKVTTTACQANAQPDKSLKLPGTLTGAGPDDSMPDIAVSTGGADTLECLMTRIGVPGSEYVAGTATTGHVHIFSGGNPQSLGLLGGIFGRRGGGAPEANPMPGAPSSPTALWMNQAQLMPYDITLLSCEGEETYNANPAALESYLNAGGRVFASHYHYAFFSGPLGTNQMYAAPPDWGASLANWTTDLGLDDNGVIGGIIDTLLNGTMTPFPKGVALKQWLTDVGALGTDGVPANELAIYQPRYNAVVVPADKPSQAWITSDSATVVAGGRGGSNGGNGGVMAPQTMYFSFDTPVKAPAGPSGPQYCGRAVFSDLHVAGNPKTMDTGNDPPSIFGGFGGAGKPPPDGCDSAAELSPQEKALEFMLFDLSSCVISDTVAPPVAMPTPPK